MPVFYAVYCSVNSKVIHCNQTLLDGLHYPPTENASSASDSHKPQAVHIVLYFKDILDGIWEYIQYLGGKDVVRLLMSRLW